MEVVYCCCCCCFLHLARAGAFRRDKKCIAALLFLSSVILVGALIWYLPYLQELIQENQSLIPEQQSCDRMCGDYYVAQTSANVCCWDLMNRCLTKSECQTNKENYFQMSIGAGYACFGAASLYSVVYITYYLFIFIKSCRAQRQASYQRLVDDHPPSTHVFTSNINKDSQTASSRLRESFANFDNTNQCPICLDQFADGKVVRLDCEHLFHSNCIRDWIKLHATCPLCRLQI